EAHYNACKRYFAAQKRTQQQSLETVARASETKKSMIFDLLKAWVTDTLRRQYLGDVFVKYLNNLKEEFAKKMISVIIDKTTDVCSRSVVNILFSYQQSTKLVSVNFLDQVNNVTIGQL
ncbi:37915_t:CDS:2, partial [Gigaspora margarita]